MGAGFLNYDPTAGELPPQAPTGVDVASSAPMPEPEVDPFLNFAAPTATDTLRRSAFGDQGADQYARLAAAGQRQANPGLSGLVGGATPPSGGAVGPGDFMALLGDVASGAAGDPLAGQKRAALEARTQAANLNAAQDSAKADQDFLEKLKKVAPQYRPGMLNEYYASQGRVVPPTMAALITDQQMLATMTSPMVRERTNTDPAFAQAYWHAMDKPKEFLTLADDLQKAEAGADKAVADAEKATIESARAPQTLDLATRKAALDVAIKLRTAQRPPTANEVETLSAAGLEAYQVPIPGISTGEKMWATRPVGSGGAAGAPPSPAAGAAGANRRVSANDFLAPNFTAPTAGAAAPGTSPTPGAATAPAPQAGVIDPTKIAKGGHRNIREQNFLAAAQEKLGPNASKVDVMHEVEKMRAQAEGLKSQTIKAVGEVTTAKREAARGLTLVNMLDRAVDKLGLAKTPEDAALQPLDFVARMVEQDPTYSVIQSFPAIMSNIARALGEKGVLTDYDILRIQKAVGVGWFDTDQTYKARTAFVKEAIRRSAAEVERVLKIGESPDYINLGDISYGKDDVLADDGAQPIQ